MATKLILLLLTPCLYAQQAEHFIQNLVKQHTTLPCTIRIQEMADTNKPNAHVTQQNKSFTITINNALQQEILKNSPLARFMVLHELKHQLAQHHTRIKMVSTLARVLPKKTGMRLIEKCRLACELEADQWASEQAHLTPAELEEILKSFN